RLYSDPEIRKKLHHEVIDWAVEMPGIGSPFGRGLYDKMSGDKAAFPKNKQFEGKSIRQIAQAQGKGIIDAFLDLAVEENLDTVFLRQGQKNEADVAPSSFNSRALSLRQS